MCTAPRDAVSGTSRRKSKGPSAVAMCDAVYEHMVGERGPENTKIQHWFDDDEGEGAVLVRCSRSALEVSVLRRVGRGDPATYSRATLDDGGIEATYAPTW